MMDEQRLEMLYLRHGNSLLRFVLTMTFGDRHLAEDIVQETFLRAWRKRGVALDGQDNCRAWLTTVARNLVIDRLRRRGRRPEEAGDEALPLVASTICEMERVVVSMAVRDALAKLTPTRRQILVEMYFRDQSLNEVAERLGIPVGTVKSRAHYALRALRTELDERAHVAAGAGEREAA